MSENNKSEKSVNEHGCCYNFWCCLCIMAGCCCDDHQQDQNYFIQDTDAKFNRRIETYLEKTKSGNYKTALANLDQAQFQKVSLLIRAFFTDKLQQTLLAFITQNQRTIKTSTLNNRNSMPYYEQTVPQRPKLERDVTDIYSVHSSMKFRGQEDFSEELSNEKNLERAQNEKEEKEREKSLLKESKQMVESILKSNEKVFRESMYGRENSKSFINKRSIVGSRPNEGLNLQNTPVQLSEKLIRVADSSQNRQSTLTRHLTQPQLQKQPSLQHQIQQQQSIRRSLLSHYSPQQQQIQQQRLQKQYHQQILQQNQQKINQIEELKLLVNKLEQLENQKQQEIRMKEIEIEQLRWKNTIMQMQKDQDQREKARLKQEQATLKESLNSSLLSKQRSLRLQSFTVNNKIDESTSGVSSKKDSATEMSRIQDFGMQRNFSLNQKVPFTKIDPKVSRSDVRPQNKFLSQETKETEEKNNEMLLLLRLFRDSKILSITFRQESFGSSSVDVRNRIQSAFEAYYGKETYRSNPIKQTNILYSYDPLQAKRFHQYLIESRSWLILAQANDGLIIGAYVRLVNGPKNPTDDSFLFSIKQTNQPYVLKSCQEIDDPLLKPDFINFGNSEFRIKNCTKSLHLGLDCMNPSYCQLDGQQVSLRQFSFRNGDDFQLKSLQIHDILFEK